MAGGSSPSPAAAPIQVRCAGCRGVLAVAPGMTEFVCPKCGMAQRLPPQLMPKPPSSSSSSATPAPAPPPPSRRGGGAPPPPPPPPQAQGVDPTKIQLPCANCQAVLNVPHGLARFRCPQCGVELAVDLAKLHNFLASSNNAAAPPDTVPPASGPASRAPSVPAPPPPPFLPVLTPGMTQATPTADPSPSSERASCQARPTGHC